MADQGSNTSVPDKEVQKVEFADYDGDKFVFTIAGTGDALVYSVNGDARPPSRSVTWHPALGVPGLRLDDIGKGFQLPQENLADILGGLRFLAKKAGIAHNIPEQVTVPEGRSIAMPEELANALLSQRGDS